MLCCWDEGFHTAARVSPHHHKPLLPSLAERSTRRVKQLLEDSPNPYQALLSCRTTPSHPVLSPAELLIGRKIWTDVPQVNCYECPQLQLNLVPGPLERWARHLCLRVFGQCRLWTCPMTSLIVMLLMILALFVSLLESLEIWPVWYAISSWSFYGNGTKKLHR